VAVIVVAWITLFWLLLGMVDKAQWTCFHYSTAGTEHSSVWSSSSSSSTPRTSLPEGSYAVIVDAGSSGSRAYVYYVVPPDRYTGARVPRVELVSSKKVDPGTYPVVSVRTCW